MIVEKPVKFRLKQGLCLSHHDVRLIFAFVKNLSISPESSLSSKPRQLNEKKNKMVSPSKYVDGSSILFAENLMALLDQL